MTQSVDLATETAAAALVQDAAITLIDVRREDEVAGVTADRATHIPRDMLELEIGSRGIAKDSKIFLLCQSGARSRFAAQAMRYFGYEDTWSVEGGFRAWLDGKHPTKRIAYLDSETRALRSAPQSIRDRCREAGASGTG